MEMGIALSKTVATYIVQKILLDDVGLDYICTTTKRFFAVGRVLANMVAALAEQSSSRLLKHIIRCYLRLSDERSCNALRSCFPDMLRDITFSSCLRVYKIHAIVCLRDTDHQPIFAVKLICFLMDFMVQLCLT